MKVMRRTRTDAPGDRPGDLLRGQFKANPERQMKVTRKGMLDKRQYRYM